MFVLDHLLYLLENRSCGIYLHYASRLLLRLLLLLLLELLLLLLLLLSR